MAVVPNRGAVAHKGGVKTYQGCRQILNLLPFLVFFTTKGAPNCHFSQGKGAAKFLSGCHELKKRLKNTALD